MPGPARRGAPVATGELLARLIRSTTRAADGDAVLAAAAELLVEDLADWVIADRLADPDLVVRVAAVGPAGPLALPDLAGAARARRSSAAAGGLLVALRAAPVPVLRFDAADLQTLAASADPRLSSQAELAAALGTVDALVLGTATRDRLHGVLALGRTATPFSGEELELLHLVADQVGLALDAARLAGAQRDVSAAMQHSLLPPLPSVPGVDLAARYQTATQGLDVGGDWYDAFVLPDDALALVIGDATGHDSAAASHMAGLRHRLRTLALDRGERPAATLTRLDRTGSLLGDSASGTCLYARLERAGAGWALSWSSAGHLPPVLVRGGRTTVAATEPDLMLGVDADSARADHEVRLAPGDVLLLCTDGLVEDRRTSIDARIEALRDAVERSRDSHPEVLADRVLADLACDGSDDVAVLVVRVLSP